MKFFTSAALLSAAALLAPTNAVNLRGLGNTQRQLNHGHLPNDECSTAVPIPIRQGNGGSTTVSGTSVGSHNEDATIVPDFCGTETERGVWYSVSVRGRKEVIFSTCNQANFDTKISIFEDPSGVCSGNGGSGSLACVAGQDDNFQAGCRHFTTELGAESIGMSTFYVLVHGFWGATGDFDLTVTVDNFENPNQAPSGVQGGNP